MLIQLTYASRTNGSLGPMDIKDILSSSARNNSALGITGSLCLSNGIFLQQLEGDRTAVNALYHRILLDKRHKEPAILDFNEIVARRFSTWAMGLLSYTQENKQLFLKYATAAEFDPYLMSPSSLRAFFDELKENVRWLT